MPLTDTACKNAKCPANKARARYSDSFGLYLEETPAGGKYWRVKYRYGGKEKRLALGIYPSVSLAQARRDRDSAKAQLEAGTDPMLAKRDAKLAEQIALGTCFEAVGRCLVPALKGPKSPRHADYVLRRLESDVFPVLGHKPVAEITAPHLLAMAKRIEKRGALDIGCTEPHFGALKRPDVSLAPRERKAR